MPNKETYTNRSNKTLTNPIHLFFFSTFYWNWSVDLPTSHRHRSYAFAIARKLLPLILLCSFLVVARMSTWLVLIFSNLTYYFWKIKEQEISVKVHVFETWNFSNDSMMILSLKHPSRPAATAAQQLNSHRRPAATAAQQPQQPSRHSSSAATAAQQPQKTSRHSSSAAKAVQQPQQLSSHRRPAA
jgi:hypothetical protein